jgi:cell division protease FtsH
VTFDDVAGIDEAKEELEEIVEFLRNPQKFSRLGGKIPKGALLVGPPGTGKTLLARAIAGEAGVPFFTISGSDFVEMFVGVGASRVRDMFEQAKKNAPCIVFNDEREQTLNQLLVEMDGFEANEGVIIVAATNRKDVLDPALLRPGRFDRQIHVPNPDIKGREKILSVHARKVPLGPDVDLRTIARGSPGFSGADLMNLVNEAALMAARVGRRFVTMVDFEQAKDKVMMGAERRSMVLTDDQKEKTAYHEAGHAIVGMALPKCDPVYKATIIPRGGALGMVVSLPEMDRLQMHKDEAKQRIAMTMAGKAAEIIKYGEEGVSSGPVGDIQQASGLARAMVMRWGMSDKIGNIDYSEAHEGYQGNTAGFSVSAETKQMIEAEVKALIDEGYQEARRILLEKSEDFERLAKGLLEYETLTGDEIRKVIAGEPLGGDDDADKPASSGGGGASVAAIPKTKGRAPKRGADPEPAPL